MMKIEPSAIRDVYVLVRRGDLLLLLLREGTGYKDGEWGPPAGKVEAGETYRGAAVRELREETGLDADLAIMRFVHLLHRFPDPGEAWPWVGAFFVRAAWTATRRTGSRRDAG
jgi:8-oxo-dGTP diphosphatase